jgi:hypothetical protein
MSDKLLERLQDLTRELESTPHCDRFAESINDRRAKRLYQKVGDTDWFVRGSNIIKKISKKKLEELFDPDLLEQYERVVNEINQCVCEELI